MRLVLGAQCPSATIFQPFWADLPDDDSAPLISGYEDGLAELRLVSKYPQQQAYFEIQ
jgi:hypothetical protein